MLKLPAPEASGTSDPVPGSTAGKIRLRVNHEAPEDAGVPGTAPVFARIAAVPESGPRPLTGLPPLLPLEARKGFYRQLGGAFGYPLKQEGVLILICGTVVFTLLSWARFLMVGFLFIGISVTSVGYTFAFMQNIISSTVNGDDEMPGWPDVSEFVDDVVQPCFRLLGFGRPIFFRDCWRCITVGPSRAWPWWCLASSAFPWPFSRWRSPTAWPA